MRANGVTIFVLRGSSKASCKGQAETLNSGALPRILEQLP
jgi:hypothetical protein